jgi:cation transport regulator ChaC
VYIFGYGSLIWRPGFPYLRKFDGYIKGWSRYFWQGSTDHRGTPEEPGRVVTLVKDADEAAQSETWGTVYGIPAEEAEVILKNLDYREKGGYTREEVDVYIRGQDGPVVNKAILYIGSQKNSCYIGETPIEVIARQIYKCVGPSGPNVDYLINLAESMRKMNVHDPHVAELEKLVKELVLLKPLPHHTHPSLVVNTPIGVSPDTLFRSPLGLDVHQQPQELPQHITTTHHSVEQYDLQRKYFLSPCAQVKGVICIDDGAVMAVSQRGRSLLPAGILDIKGTFKTQELVSIVNKHGEEVSRGITFYASEEIENIKGQHSSKISSILGFSRGEVVVHNHNMILV